MDYASVVNDNRLFLVRHRDSSLTGQGNLISNEQRPSELVLKGTGTTEGVKETHREVWSKRREVLGPVMAKLTGIMGLQTQISTVAWGVTT